MTERLLPVNMLNSTNKKLFVFFPRSLQVQKFQNNRDALLVWVAGFQAKLHPEYIVYDSPLASEIILL